MNGIDFLSACVFITLLAPWIDGLSNRLPPEKCYLVQLKANSSYNKQNKKPSKEHLKQIITILTPPSDPSNPVDHGCNRTSVSLGNVQFFSDPSTNIAKLDVVLKVDPHKSVSKVWAHNCADNMLYQGSVKVKQIERYLRFRNDSSTPPHYMIDKKSCCEEQHVDDEPCCRKGYTLKNQICEINETEKKISKKGEVVTMERESDDNCEPKGSLLSVGIIIIIACSGLVFIVAIALAGVRLWNNKHRPNRIEYNDVPEAATAVELESQEHREISDSSAQNVGVPEEEVTRDGYMKMTSKTNLRDHNPTTASSSNNDGDESSSPKLRRQTRPKSRSETMFHFDKHIPIEDIQFTNRMLGRGQFGQVELAYATIKGITKECAVKMIRGRGTAEDERELFEELQMLYQIPHHPNVVSLLGGCMDDDSPLYVVVEYCANGSLLRYLQKHRTRTNEYVNFSAEKLDFRWKLQRAVEICTGMIFLSQRQIIHRDLAARNILLDENEVAKISDFGMAKDVYLRGLYIKETSGFLPVRWMAIEAIESSIYTIKSDMWSFGVLLWELYMDGLNPYPGITDGSELLEKYLKKGLRMSQPENCPDSLYQLMEKCWLEKPEDRPQFAQALRQLELIKEEEMRRLSEASKATETSDIGDVSVFDDVPQNETPVAQQDSLTHQMEDTTKVNMAENNNPTEIGLVNRGRSSIDSGTHAPLSQAPRKNSTEQTSYC